MTYRPRVMQGTWFAALVRRVLHPHDVRLVVNANSEVGVEIFGRVFFTYKGKMIEYRAADRPAWYRPVGKRELGETLRVAPEVFHQSSPENAVGLPAGPELCDSLDRPRGVPFWKRESYRSLVYAALGLAVGMAIGRCMFSTWLGQ